MFARRVLLNRRAFSSNSSSFRSNFFKDERVLGTIALLVTIPTAAYLWKRHDAQGTIKEAIKPPTTLIPLSSKNSIKTKYLIVGGGVAGYSALESIISNDPGAPILLVSDEEELPYLRPPLSKELWNSKSNDLSFSDWQGNKKELRMQPATFYQENGVKVRLATAVTGIDAQERRALLADGSVVEYEEALIATGARPKTLPELPVNDESITTFRSLSDFRKLRDRLTSLPTGSQVLIVGGGFLGSELAASLSQLKDSSPRVTQVFPESGPMALVFPKYLSEWTRDKLAALGVAVIPKATIKEVVKGDSAQLKVKLSNDRELTVDHVIVAVGVEPTMPELGNVNNGTDEHLQLAPSLFGAGDAIEYPDASLGIKRRTEHYDHAVQSGKLAGENMVRSSRKEPLKPYIHESMFWSDLGSEVGYEAVGLIDSSLTTVSVWARAAPRDQPAQAELDPSDVRLQPLGQTAVRSDPSDSTDSNNGFQIVNKASDSSIPHYGKGVVFYLKDQRLVGVLLFNLFNRVALARSLIADGSSLDDISKCVNLININE